MSDQALRILMVSKPFFPMVGGVETVAAILASEMAALGQHVTVVTSAESSQKDSFSYKIVRKPSLWRLFKLFCQADRILINGVTLGMGWPVFFRPSVSAVIHHGFINPTQRFSFLRRFLLRQLSNIAISNAVGVGLPGRVTHISNPYDAATFYTSSFEHRSSSLIFVGRLVPEKGLHVLIEALSLLKQAGFCYPLTVVGDGPYLLDIRALIKTYGLESQVSLVGKVIGKALAELFNSHHMAIVPSIWDEPFGLVALEALACGCQVIGTERGGLFEAIGACGRLVPNGNAVALSVAIRDTANLPPLTTDQLEQRLTHLRQFQPSYVGRAYLNHLRNLGE